MKSKKKILIIILPLIVAICVLGYIIIKIINPTIKAVIVKPTENHLTVMDIKNEDLYYIFLPEDIKLNFKQGQEILVYCKYDTLIEHSNPASISEQYVKKIKILEENSNVRNTRYNIKKSL